MLFLLFAELRLDLITRTRHWGEVLEGFSFNILEYELVVYPLGDTLRLGFLKSPFLVSSGCRYVINSLGGTREVVVCQSFKQVKFFIY